MVYKPLELQKKRCKWDFRVVLSKIKTTESVLSLGELYHKRNREKNIKKSLTQYLLKNLAIYCI
jgi:hypothetical protein